MTIARESLTHMNKVSFLDVLTRKCSISADVTEICFDLLVESELHVHVLAIPRWRLLIRWKFTVESVTLAQVDIAFTTEIEASAFVSAASSQWTFTSAILVLAVLGAAAILLTKVRVIDALAILVAWSIVMARFEAVRMILLIFSDLPSSVHPRFVRLCWLSRRWTCTSTVIACLIALLGFLLNDLEFISCQRLMNSAAVHETITTEQPLERVHFCLV